MPQSARVKIVSFLGCSVTVPFETDVTSLVPIIVISGSSVNPASGVAQNFTNPVFYTVTAEDGTTQNYVVTVTVAQDPITTIFEEISSSLDDNGIANNLNLVTSDNVNDFPNLYFEKYDEDGMALGRLTFASELDLADPETQTFLQNLGDYLDQGNGRIALDVSTATALAGKGATLEMYDITSASESNLIVRDDDGNIISPSGIVSNFTYDPVTDTVSFDASHFTQFDIDTIPPEIEFHDNVTAEATSESGAVIDYTTPQATDNIDPTTPASCDPVSGAMFTIGDTLVTCTKNDTAGNSAIPTTFTVTVTANTPPSFNPIADQAVNEDSSSQDVSITNVSPGPSEESGQTVTLSATSSDPAIVPNPSVSGSGSTRTLAYTPAANKHGSATITVTADDGQPLNNAYTQTFTITVNPVNDDPIAVDDNYSTDEDTALNVGAPGVLDNDSDVDNSNLSAVLVTSVAHGILTFNADGSFLYTPASNYSGQDSFTYTANDGTIDGNTATVNITVVDTTAPSAPGTPATATPTKDTTPTWTWTAATDNVGVDHYIFYWDTVSGGEANSSGSLSSATLSFTHSSALTSGTWYGKVRAYDADGNSGVSAVGSVVIDAEAPVGNIAINSGAAYTKNNDVTLNFSGVSVDVVSMELELGNGVSGSYQASIAYENPHAYTLPNNGDGTYTVRVRFTDAVGNISVGPISDSIVLDKTNPTDPTDVASTSHEVNTPSNETTIDIAWTAAGAALGATDGGSGVDGYSYDFTEGTTDVPDAIKDAEETSTGTISTSLDDGSWYFHLRTQDNAGNWTSTVHKGPFVIDATTPDTLSLNPTIDPMGSNYVRKTVTVAATATDDSGVDSVVFTMFDDDNNEKSCSGIQDGDNPDLWSCQIDTTTLSDTNEETDMTIKVTDLAGNTTTEYYSDWNDYFGVDNTVPTDPTPESTSHTESTWSSNPTVDVSWEGADDDSSGVDGYYTEWNTSPDTLTHQPSNEYTDGDGGLEETSPSLADGNNHYFHVATVDQAGNWTSTAHLGPFWIDTTNPTDPTPSSASHTTSTWSKDNTVDVTWTGASDATSGIDGFYTEWNTSATTITGPADKEYEKTVDSETSPALSDGNDHYFHIATLDNAGNWTSTAHFGPFWIDATAPTVTKLGDNSADITLSTGNTDLVFSEVLSGSSKTVVQNALSAGADKTLTYSWTGATLTITATETTTFTNDVVVNVSDLAGNMANSLLLVDSSLATSQTTPNNDGDATADSDSPEVVITDPDQEVTITVDGTTDATIDVSSFVDGGTGNVPQISINSDAADITIPATTVTGPVDWNGVIAAPTVTTVTLPVTAGETTTLGTAIEIGFASAKLSFDNAVRILLPGQAGKRAGYSRPGTDFTEITSTCAADSQAAGDALATDGECKIDVGGDLVIWTKHFTKFASYTQTTSGGSGGTSGGGGGGGTSPASAPTCNDTQPGSAPVLLSAVSAGANSVTLTWSKATDPVTYYLITYGLGTGLQQYGNPNVGGSNTTSYTVSGLSGGTTYYFKVRAGNGCAPGEFSNELSTTPAGGVLNSVPEGFEEGVLGEATELNPELTPSPVPSPSPEVRGTSTSNFNWWWVFIPTALLGLIISGLLLRRRP